MNCAQFEHRIQTILDRRGNPGTDALLLRHARTCAECRELLEQYEQLLVAFPVVQLEQPAADLADRVCQHLLASGNLRPKWMSWWYMTRTPWTYAAAAAACLIVLGTLNLWTFQGALQGRNRHTAGSHNPQNSMAVQGALEKSAPLASHQHPAGTQIARATPSQHENPRRPDQPEARPPSSTDSALTASERREAAPNSSGAPPGGPVLAHTQPAPFFAPLNQLFSLNIDGTRQQPFGAALPKTLEPLADWLEQTISNLTNRLPSGMGGERKEPQAGRLEMGIFG
jgi:hypothetical protein